MLLTRKFARLAGGALAVVAVGILAVAGVAGGQQQPAPAAPAHDHPHPHPPVVVPPITKAVAVLQPTEGSEVRGTVTFTRVDDGVLVEAEVTGLDPNSKHGFHIHQYGDLRSDDGMATGGHYNPTGEPHGAPDNSHRHVGDFGNIETDEDGVGRYRRVDDRLTFEGPTSIIGRGLIVHEGEDDLETQPTGDAGGRAAQAVIGVASANDE